MKTFEDAAVNAELDALLMSAGLEPSDLQVQAIRRIVSGYYAERTAEVLTKVREVLDRFGTGAVH